MIRAQRRGPPPLTGRAVVVIAVAALFLGALAHGQENSTTSPAVNICRQQKAAGVKLTPCGVAVYQMAVDLETLASTTAKDLRACEKKLAARQNERLVTLCPACPVCPVCVPMDSPAPACSSVEVGLWCGGCSVAVGLATGIGCGLSK